MAPTELRRGDVWLVSLGAARAGELGKNRPAVVMTVDSLLAAGPEDHVQVIGLSSSRAPSVLRPPVGAEAGVDRDSVAVCRAVRSVATSRLMRRLGRVTEQTMVQIEDALIFILNLDGA